MPWSSDSCERAPTLARGVYTYKWESLDMSNENHNPDSQSRSLNKEQLWNKLVKAELGDSGVDLINAEDWSEEQPPEPNYKQEIPEVNKRDGDGEQSYGDDHAVLVAEAVVGQEGERRPRRQPHS